jgi:hypothetical protein
VLLHKHVCPKLRWVLTAAAGSDDCAEALGQSGACEALVHILGLSSIPHKLLCNGD